MSAVYGDKVWVDEIARLMTSETEAEAGPRRDLLYSPKGQTAHLVNLPKDGVRRALCSRAAGTHYWRGLDTPEERQRARTMPLCVECALRAAKEA